MSTPPVMRGAAGGVTVDQRRIADLERENRELRRANEILKAATTPLQRRWSA
jgi:transposase-like protein